MTIVGIVSPGAMGSALGAALAAGGARAVATVSGRSERTRHLAEGLDLLESLDEVVATAGIVLSVVPPGEAPAVAAAVAAAAERCGARPLVADLNAVSPATARALEAVVAHAGLDLVDGSVSGPPPRHARETRIYLSGRRAPELSALAAPGVAWRLVGDEVGAASAVKMSTASVYKGTVAVLLQALRAAEANGVLAPVLDDLAANGLVDHETTGPSLARASRKAWRYVPEMREIAATQSDAGLSPALFEAFAEVFADVAARAKAGDPEDVPAGVPVEDVVRAIAAVGRLARPESAL